MDIPDRIYTYDGQQFCGFAHQRCQWQQRIWAVGSSATLGTNTMFAGNIVALASITLNTGASITCGRALARNGAVTLDSNVITLCVANGNGDVGDITDDDLGGGGVAGFQRAHSALRASSVRLC